MDAEDLSRAIGNREFLGRIERNVEFKIIAPVLAMLGWDPLEQTHWGFQIARVAYGDPEKRSANEADVVVGDRARVFLVGEAKRAGDVLELRLPQIRANQQALGATRGFLTDGRRWLVLDLDGVVVADIDLGDADNKIAALAPWLGRDAVDGSTWRYPAAWNVGLSLGRMPRTGASGLPPTWNSDDYEDPIVRTLVAELSLLVADLSDVLVRDASERSLFVRARSHPSRAIVEFPSTLTGRLVKRPADWTAMGVPERRQNEWAATVDAVADVESAADAILLLRRIVEELLSG